jgi:hypothetical protein
MTYELDCLCGKRVGVLASAAGTEVACECGAVVPVPKLSVLRERSGQGAYESGPIDTIQRMRREGTLPSGDCCAACGRPTNDVIDLRVECERIVAADDNMKLKMFLALLISPLVFLSMRNPAKHAVGRDTVIEVPLRMCQKHRAWLTRSRQRKLRRLLCCVPVYQKLLIAYPGARVIVPKLAATTVGHFKSG